jgi:hypothetical protein
MYSWGMSEYTFIGRWIDTIETQKFNQRAPKLVKRIMLNYVK